MQRLSKNIICEIFSFLTLKEICVVSGTCTHFYKASQADFLWTQTSDEGSGSARKRIFCLRGLRTSRVFSNLYQVYMLSGHSRTINTVKVSENKVLTASEDNSVRLFNIKKSRGKVIINHSNSVTSALFCGKGVISASADRTLKLWKKNKDVASVTAHKSGITKLRLINPALAISGGYDGTTKLWDLNNDRILPVLSNQDFGGDISVLETCGNFYAACSSNDNSICIRDLENPSTPLQIEM